MITRILSVLPLRKDAPLFPEPKAKPDFGTDETLVKLQSLEIVNRSGVEFGK